MSSFVAVVLVVAVVLAGSQGASAYHKGDTLHLARRAQFNQKRTEWHEIFGRFCPHFAVNDVVAVPLAKPHGFEKGDDYKLSLALDHYNFHTSWMRVINGKKASVSIPMVHVNLVHAGEEVTSFRAKVVPLPQEYSNTHAESINHFKNQTHWPKLLVVKYEWEERDLVRLDAGIAAITLLGVVVGAYLMAKIVSKSKGELEEFVNDISSEDGLSLAARREMIKGE
ncbi:hypothetical protein HOP50_02g18210 [Chloropicon primus]|uniref:Uncharacterized protein n=1 Tax=Chloropicon primus TaxID=1764295 RepID=A0A5B8MFT3_9CHLO|nr:hypothetical protein A3770_02p18240 [Chloropicon primus]UPQ98515.1 hypothetical protein HOP50_02g18210 [Chloropicon primus]|eukprot:QDZ19306.1 hypothetical protein A3770_02p18240 [Chloropicon primus]